MRTPRIIAALLPLALAACGAKDKPQAAAFQEAAPSYAALAVDVTGDATTGGMAAGPAMLAEPAPLDAAAVTTADGCHPHLFLRTAELALRVNRHLWKFLRHVELLTTRTPDHLDGSTATWQAVHGLVEVRWTITKVSDKAFKWLLEARSVAHPDWLAIFRGQIDRSNAAGPHQGAGSATLDLDALHTVVPAEPATGVIDATFEAFAEHRKLVVDATQVAWDAAGLSFVVATPANAHYVYYRAPGKGGSFKAQDTMAFACPVAAQSGAANVDVLARWTVTGGEVHGRSDARMVGGQLPAGNRVVGLTCHQATLATDPQLEGYWLMKQEDGTGATVAAWVPAGGATACDAVFGPVPTVADVSNDFDFTSVDFGSDAPGPFPGGP